MTRENSINTEISSQQEKENLWQKEKEIVDRITDRLGLEIDKGIKDTVIALRLSGVNTTSSHEGKIHRYPVPYIDIASIEGIKLKKERNSIIKDLKSDEEKDIFKQIDVLIQEMQNTDDQDIEKDLRVKINILEKELDKFKYPKSKELDELKEKIKQENLNEQRKIEDLLNSFYENRLTDSQSKLVLEILGFGEVRLQSFATETQEEETNEENKIERLALFQKEMNDFTKFLKNKFFEV
jgi:hypothetical protein